MSAPATAAEREEYEYLQTPRAIRERAEAVFDFVRTGRSACFELDESKLATVVERVARITRAAYPDVSRIPVHGRYRHFDVGGVPRLAQFDEKISHFSAEEQLAARFELVITSVLLDAGAGNDWSYNGYSRSEGLAVASYDLFISGALGGSAAAPRADAVGLRSVTVETLGAAFQVSASNPLAGLDGRAALLRRLGEVIAHAPEYFGSSELSRVGGLGVWLLHQARAGELPAPAILAAVLREIGPVWRGRPHLAGLSLGDVWRHSQLGFVPFHKLSQWLTYSLFEPLEQAGLRITHADELTGLAEYRNGGLFLDSGVLRLRDPSAASRVHPVDSDLVIEWRALTLALLDRTAVLLRTELGLSSEQLPLARVLEAGTWRAGREIASELRESGGPPLQIDSDGTVF